MTRISYKIIMGFGEMREFHEGGAEVVEIRVDGLGEGVISVGRVTSRLRDGVAHLSLSHILDGDYTPRIVRDGEVIYLERVRKMGKNLTRPPLDAELVSRLALRVDALETRCRGLEDECHELRARVNPAPIF